MLRLFQRMKRGYPLLLLGRRGLLPRCRVVQLHDLADLLPLRAADRYHLGLLLLQLTHRDHRAFTPPRLTAPRRRLQTVLQLQPGARALGRTPVVAPVPHRPLVTDPAHHHMHMVISVADHHARVLLETYGMRDVS
ncbi:hypothetical protein AS25_12590 [Kocuria marina]|uniref:Uncharacterized protein n=1 Tax=Kocuria marina TaxID=223184 RepID=A0A0B0DDM2_9MICC|nr:hypothetical protein AS25_12590 [Kocuria marina]